MEKTTSDTWASEHKDVQETRVVQTMARERGGLLKNQLESILSSNNAESGIEKLYKT